MIVETDRTSVAHIRWLINRDMREIEWTEQGTPDPWVREDFVRCLRRRNCIGMVAEIGERVVGHMLYELHRSKLEVLRFAVHPAYLRRGVGRVMISKLVSKLSSHRRTRLCVSVSESNLDMLLFLRACGLEAVRLDRGNVEDAVRMFFEAHGLEAARGVEDSVRMVYRLPAEAAVDDGEDCYGRGA